MARAMPNEQMANRYYTVMVIPEKTSKVRRVLVPGWIVRGTLVALLFLAILAFIMALDYGYVMNQISENRELKLENRRLRQQVQIFNNKIKTIEDTMDRVQTFATKLKVITNIEDKQAYQQRLQSPPSAEPDVDKSYTEDEGERHPQKNASDARDLLDLSYEPDPERDPEEIQLRIDKAALESRFTVLDSNTLQVEQNLEDLYELLAGQRSFLDALPTRRPAQGYYTSFFGVRQDPTQNAREKMHEGMDIANRAGTVIVATANGVVRFAGIKPGYGQTVVIDHGYGLSTYYGHCRRLFVKKGQKISRGQRVAAMGSTGRSTGPHVHYEVRIYDIPVDPTSYILEN